VLISPSTGCWRSWTGLVEFAEPLHMSHLLRDPLLHDLLIASEPFHDDGTLELLRGDIAATRLQQLARRPAPSITQTSRAWSATPMSSTPRPLLNWDVWQPRRMAAAINTARLEYPAAVSDEDQMVAELTGSARAVRTEVEYLRGDAHGTGAKISVHPATGRRV
jgi:hypothetical protein